jgi:hypothetical protein
MFLMWSEFLYLNPMVPTIWNGLLYSKCIVSFAMILLHTNRQFSRTQTINYQLLMCKSDSSHKQCISDQTILVGWSGQDVMKFDVVQESFAARPIWSAVWLGYNNFVCLKYLHLLLFLPASYDNQ